MFSAYDSPDNEAQKLSGHDVFSAAHYNQDTDEYEIVPYPNDLYFTIKKPVPYFNTSGEYIGTLDDGDMIKITRANFQNTGYSRPWCLRVSAVKFSGNDDYETLTCYVSIGLEYGTSTEDRAWL